MVSGQAARPAAGRAAWASLLVGLAAVGLARGILLPGQGFWDTGEFQTVPPLLGTAHPTGYPTYVILGWLASIVLAPLGEPAFRMNLLSAILLGAASALTVALVRGLTSRTDVAVAAGLLLALTPIPWRMGGFADPHTLHLALSAGLLVLLVGWAARRRAGRGGADRWLLAASVLYGVMLGNHTLTVLLAPGIALYVLAVEPAILHRRRFAATCAAVVAATTGLLYLQLPIRAAMGAPLVYGHPDTLDGFLYVVLAAQFRGDLVDPFGDLLRKAGDLASLAVAQLGILAPLVPLACAVVLARRPRFALLSGAWLLATCWFAASYTNADIERYYLGPVLVAVAWLAVAAGLAVDALASRFGPARAGLASTILGAAAAGLLLLPAALAAPSTARSVDQSGDSRAADWSRWVLQALPADSVVVSWWSYSTPLWYRTLVLGERPDVLIVDDRDRLDEGLGSIDDVVRANLGRRPVFVIPDADNLPALLASWAVQPLEDPWGQQPLYRVAGPHAAGRADGRSPGPAGLATATMAP